MKKIALLFALCVCIFAGCRKDPKPPKDITDRDRTVVVFFSTKSATSSILKATSDEDKISKIILFGVDDLNNVVETYAPINNPPLTGTKLTISPKVKMLYAIANPSDGLEAATPSTVSGLMNLIGDFTDAPQSPFLMSGNASASGYNVNIELIRAVAKISITGTNDFRVETVTVTNTPNQGYVFRRAPFSIPASHAKVGYPAIASTDPILYVAENTGNSPTQFTVTGTFQGSPASYTIVLESGVQKNDIVRNTWYRVGITPITESECDITITVPEWNDVIINEFVTPE